MAPKSPLKRRQEQQVSSIDGFNARSTDHDALATELESHLPSGWSVSELTYTPDPAESDTPTCSLTLAHDHSPVSIVLEPASTARPQCAIRPLNSHRVVLMDAGDEIEKVAPETMFEREEPAQVFAPVVAAAKAAIDRHGLWFYTGNQ
ncbi:hypothetical protein ACFQDD_00515 [Halorubrum pallidum]|uniref:Uncharacterized protein n=1 Tax=Halorubrum pallidum TaxID=1526114 RepID=A0ABD5SYI9_9EURY